MTPPFTPHHSPFTIPALIASLLFVVGPAAARDVTVPVRLDHEFLRQGLLAQVYADGDGKARVWTDGSGCNFLTLADPQVDGHDGRIRVMSEGAARIGTPIGDHCLVALDWKGFIEVFEQPYLDPAAPIVRFRVVDSNLYGRDMKKQVVSGKLWDLVKGYVHPRLESLRVDLQGALAELRGVLPLVLPDDDAERAQRLIDSVSLASVDPSDSGVSATIRFTLPDRGPRTAPPAEPTLTPEELQRWELAWQQWDGFLTFVLKRAAGDAGARELRQALLEVLLDGRHDLLEALAPSAPGVPDPVRPLFVKTWARLAPVLHTLGTGLPGEAALRYLSFIAAGDALQAVDQLGPDIGLDISADGLRRLARMIAPTASEDPLLYSLAVDPDARQLFGFGPPLPPPADNPDVDLSGWLFSVAWAAIEPDVVARLNRWVPARNEIDDYLPLVRDLLLHTVRQTTDARAIEAQFRDVYRWLILAAAWEESCWRQFIKEGGKIKPIRSPVGSIGLMQVNQKVWRGFYDVRGLQQDISYNATAGSEIMEHYLIDYAVAKGEHTATGNTDNLARSSYSMYNGGPGHLRRYRNPKTSKTLRKIDELFWEKYRAVKDGRELDVVECYGG